MFHKITNGFKNTYGFILSFPNRIDNSGRGLAHLAEHFIFSGCTGIDKQTFHQKQAELFTDLEATTSRDRIRIFAYCSRPDLQESLSLISEMILNWQCPVDDFQKEKDNVITEAEDYYASQAFRRRQAIYKCLPLEYWEPIGNVDALEIVSQNDLTIIKDHWLKLISNGCDLLIIGPEMSTKETKIADTLGSRQTTVENKFLLKESDFKCTEHCELKFFKSNVFRLESLILDAVIRRRWQQSDFRGDYEFLQVSGVTCFALYDENGLKNAEKKNILDIQVHRDEFESARNHLVAYCEMTLDAPNIIESLHWWEGFANGSYCLPEDLFRAEKITEFYKNISYDNFNAYLEIIF